MRYLATGGAIALPMLLAGVSAPAHADHEDDHIVAIGQRADEHGPAGIMGEHVHRDGELMVGFAWMRDEFGGANQSGTRTISGRDIAMAGYTARTRSMTMDMAMMHLMWAPNDRITLTVMPVWMRMEMTMLGIGAHDDDGHDGGGEHGGHHALAPGEMMKHSVSGIGDTELGVLVALSGNRKLSAHAGLAVSIPTGSVSRKGHDGAFVHYGMQPGSGTWDLIPSFTLSGGNDALRWGAQARHEFRVENRNESGFRFGDRLDANVWLAKPLSPAAAVTARVAYSDEGKIEGHYNGAHSHAAPPDRQGNYGGQLLQAGLGANVVIGGNLRLGAEATLPVYQDLNGIQAPRKFGVSLNLSRMF